MRATMRHMNNTNFLEPNQEAPENCDHENEVHSDEDEICPDCKEHCSNVSCKDCEEDLGSDCCGA